MNKKTLAAGAVYLLVEMVAASAGLFVGMAAATGFELEPLAAESGVVIFGTAVLFMHGLSHLVFGPRFKKLETAEVVIAPAVQVSADQTLDALRNDPEFERKVAATATANRNRLGK